MPLSYSQLRSYATCPRQFEYAFVKKLKTPLTPEMCFGVSVHTTLSKWGRLEQVSGGRFQVSGKKEQTSLFPAENVALPETYNLTPDTLARLWHSSFVTEGYPTLAASEFDRLRGEKLMEGFFAWWVKEPRKVVGIEKGFSAPLSSTEAEPKRGRVERPLDVAPPLHSPLAHARGSVEESITITGRFDRVEELSDGTLRIIDFKSGSLRSQEAVDQDLQLSIYCIAAKEAFGKDASELVMLFLDEDVTEVRTSRLEGELRTAAKTISLVSERIASKDYRPCPSREVCRNCPYRRVCDVAAV